MSTCCTCCDAIPSHTSQFPRPSEKRKLEALFGFVIASPSLYGRRFPTRSVFWIFPKMAFTVFESAGWYGCLILCRCSADSMHAASRAAVLVWMRLNMKSLMDGSASRYCIGRTFTR